MIPILLCRHVFWFLAPARQQCCHAGISPGGQRGSADPQRPESITNVLIFLVIFCYLTIWWYFMTLRLGSWVHFANGIDNCRPLFSLNMHTAKCNLRFCHNLGCTFCKNFSLTYDVVPPLHLRYYIILVIIDLTPNIYMIWCTPGQHPLLHIGPFTYIAYSIQSLSFLLSWYYYCRI